MNAAAGTGTPEQECNRAGCENPVTEPYTEACDPLRRVWCSEECHDSEAEAYWTERWTTC